MKILLISAFFPPEVGSAAHLFFELGQALLMQGHEVTVLTGLPRYHVLGGKKTYRQRSVIQENYHGLKVVRVFNLDIPWNKPILRGLDQWVSALVAGLAGGILLPSFDVALVYSPPLPLALAAWGLARWRRWPIVVNIQDLIPQSVIDLGVLKDPYLIRVFRKLESFVYRRADLVVAHSEGNRQHIIAAGGDPNKVMLIPNWIDTEAIRPSGRNNDLRASLGLEGNFIVSFAGIMGYSQDLETVLYCADLLRDQNDIAFLLVGDGVEKVKLEEMAKDNNLSNVLFLPMQSKERYAEVLAASDLCLVTLRKEVRTPVVPSKILSIMAAGRPILASLSLEGDAPRLIDEAQCGQCVSPGQPEAMAKAILQIFGSTELRKKMGANGRQYAVEHYSLKKCVKHIESCLTSICS
jgi:glycosyltransferase involved in cell wall biosynthesis